MGEISGEWGKVNVIKKGQKNNPGKYRQVSFTLVPGKIMEQVILEHISGHMKEKRVSGNRKWIYVG